MRSLRPPKKFKIIIVVAFICFKKRNKKIMHMNIFDIVMRGDILFIFI